MYSCDHIAVERFVVASARRIPITPDGVVYWCMMNWGDDLEKYDQIEIFRQVFEHYNHELWPIRFVSTSDPEKAYFRIAFVREDGKAHLPDGTVITCPFSFADSPETIAVFHYSNAGSWAGWGFMNEKYYFAKAHSTGRTDLYKVLLHELGHGLGLRHTESPGDIMLPVYDAANTFTQDSRSGLDQIFGETRRDLLIHTDSARHLFTLNPVSRRRCLRKLLIH